MTISNLIVQLFGTCPPNVSKLFCRSNWSHTRPLTLFWGLHSKKIQSEWPFKDFWSFFYFLKLRPKMRHNSVTVWATELIFISNSIIFDVLQFGISHLGRLGLVWAVLESGGPAMIMPSWKYPIIRFFYTLSVAVYKCFRPPRKFLRLPRTIYVHQSQS